MPRRSTRRRARRRSGARCSPRLAGVNSVSGPGMLDFLLVFSLPKLVLDDELCGQALRFVREVRVLDDMPTRDLVDEVLPNQHLIMADHTTRHWPRGAVPARASDRSRQPRELDQGRGAGRQPPRHRRGGATTRRLPAGRDRSRRGPRAPADHQGRPRVADASCHTCRRRPTPASLQPTLPPTPAGAVGRIPDVADRRLLRGSARAGHHPVASGENPCQSLHIVDAREERGRASGVLPCGRDGMSTGPHHRDAMSRLA